VFRLEFRLVTIAPQEIARLDADAVVLLDQRLLPAARVERRLSSWPEVAEAISRMVVRGAPAIGIAAAYGAALAARGGRDELEAALEGLVAARPTAVNLPWALGLMAEEAARSPDGELAARLERRAGDLHAEEVERCREIGRHGAQLVPTAARVLTHCNAGALATGGYGTALGVVRAAYERDPDVSVWVDETRPLLQGARLTAWELEQDGIAATLLADSMAGWLMAQRKVDLVITGADRIARNGDAANKIGTYALSVLAGAHGVPFYVAAPSSTIDGSLATGAEIPIEHRSAAEVAGEAAPPGVSVYNPAFDVTPAENITAIVSERGVHRPPFRFG
jgi:methylthioribose-1-phosphate isomerase